MAKRETMIGNKFAVGNNGGRPRKYKTPESLLKVCDEYFIYIKGETQTVTREIYDEAMHCFKKVQVEEWLRNPEPPTVTGLILFLGFSDRGSLDDYEKKKEFSHIIKKARSKVEYGYELRLQQDKPVGAIFALKNMGWKDKVETGFTDKNGNDLAPNLVFNPAPKCEPLTATDG